MATASFTKVNDAIESLMNGGTNLGTDTLLMAFTNTAPASETSNPLNDNNGIKTNITEIAYGGFYTDSLTVDRTLQSVTSTQTGGTWTLDCADWTMTASGGSIPAWQYIYLWDDTIASPVDPLLAHWDYGSAINLADGDTANININASGLISVA